MNKTAKFRIFDGKKHSQFWTKFGQKWPTTDHIGADFVGPEVFKPSQYFYLGAHPAPLAVGKLTMIADHIIL